MRLKLQSFLKNCIFFFHHLWILTGIFGLTVLARVLTKSNENRSSITANREIIEMLEPAWTALSLASLGMIISLVAMRRKLKHGTVRRLGVSWKRVLLGAVIPLAIPTFLIRDIERLSQLPRNEVTKKEHVRKYKASRKSIFLSVLLVIFAYISSPLENALFGIIYITEGTASIDDPLRYALKWVEPQVITNAFDEYSQYIWIGSISFCIMVILISVVSWLLLQNCVVVTRRALA